MTSPPRQSIDAWREAHWGEPGACSDCGDPIILADTEEWKRPRCIECWHELGCPEVEPS